MKVPADELPSAPAASGSDAGAEPAGSPAQPARHDSAHQVALTELRRQLTAWMRHEPGARLGRDPEELHQLRVAVRRIDAILGLFRHQLPGKLVRTRNGAKSLLRTLGAVRDFDVQLAELERYCESLPETERAAAVPLRAQLEAERTLARARMIRTLDSEHTRHWLEALNLGSADHLSGGAIGAEPVEIVMSERVQKRFRKLRKTVRGLGPKSAMEEYHLVRRRAKQLRYALEPGAELYGKPAQGMLKALRRLQDGLGEHQDAHAAKNRLAAIAAATGNALPAETLFLMGRLAEHHLNVTTRARKTLSRSWSKTGGKRWKVLRARLEQLSADAATRSEQAALAVGAEAPAAQANPAEPEQAPAVQSQPLRH
jgi:triphosphatase